MSTKEEQIKAKLAKPIEVGDYVAIRVPYTKKEHITEGKGKKKVTKTIDKECLFYTTGTVREVKGFLTTSHNKYINYGIELGSISIPHEVDIKTNYDGTMKLCQFKAEHVSPTVIECGTNPFKKESFRVSFYNKDIWAILFAACYDKHEGNFDTPTYNTHNGQDGDKVRKEFIGKTYGGVNFDPYVVDTNGEKQHYQRGLVWNLEQKQLLIDSIYNNIEIGKFLFRHNTWDRMEKGMLELGHGYSWDCVDGKQRFFAILHFLQNKYPDSYGNYWNDLSSDAQRHFLNYGNLSYGEMGGQAKDSDVKDCFVKLNTTGTQVTHEHLDFVRVIKI